MSFVVKERHPNKALLCRGNYLLWSYAQASPSWQLGLWLAGVGLRGDPAALCVDNGAQIHRRDKVAGQVIHGCKCQPRRGSRASVSIFITERRPPSLTDSPRCGIAGHPERRSGGREGRSPGSVPIYARVNVTMLHSQPSQIDKCFIQHIKQYQPCMPWRVCAPPESQRGMERLWYIHAVYHHCMNVCLISSLSFYLSFFL